MWQEKKLYGKVSMGVVRSTFVINENGMIEKVMPKVKPDTNATEILDWTDAYSMEIARPEDALYCLMIVLAIDAVKCSQGN